MLECTNCGAVGDSFFSTNFSGEMVCELCGTQSFQQARNETQDVEDMGIDVMRVSQMLKRQQPRKKRKGEGKLKPSEKRQTPTKQKPGDVELRDCLIATQTILDFQARTLVERVGVETFPPDYIRVVKELWFKFMETWGTKGEVPLLRCFTEFFLPNRLKEENCDPTITRDMLEQWDADREQKQAEQEQEERESEEKREDQSRTEETKAEDNEAVKKYEQDSIKSEGGKRRRKRRNMSQWKSADYTERLDKFSIMDLLGLLMLSSRVLNLGLLPSDFANWISTGVLPFHNLLATACMDAPDVREAVDAVAMFFESVFMQRNVSSVRIAYIAHKQQYQMGLRLPPLNVPLAAHRLCGLLGFPGEVFRNFQWITGFINVAGDQPELPLLLQTEAINPKTGSKTPLRSKSYVEQLLATETGIVAHLVVAVRMCAGWEEWVFERNHQADARDKAPPATAVFEPHLLPRRDLDSFVKFCEQAFTDPSRPKVPVGFQDHVDKLNRLQMTNELLAPENDPRREDTSSLKQNDIYAYPAIHVDGILAENDADIEQHVEGLRSQETKGDWRDDEKDPTYFYPKYTFSSQRRGAMHSAFENLLELLCQQIGAPIATVLSTINELDRRIERLCKHLEFTERDFKSLIRRRYDNPLPNLAIDAKWKTEPTDILAKKEEN